MPVGTNCPRETLTTQGKKGTKLYLSAKGGTWRGKDTQSLLFGLHEEGKKKYSIPCVDTKFEEKRKTAKSTVPMSSGKKEGEDRTIIISRLRGKGQSS